ncbi:MAG: HEAT repeat domain-containing protein [Planctomycetota bacterium]
MHRIPLRTTPRSLCIHATALALALSSCLGSGCVSRMDPVAARNEFSSKERSMSASSASGARIATASHPEATHIPLGDGPVTLSAPTSEGQSAAAAVPERLRADAESILRQAAQNSWAALRAHAIEASVGNPALLAELAPRGLADENRGVRFVSCMAIAEARATGVAVLAEPLLADESGSVRAAAMLVMSRAGRKVDLTPLAAMAFDSDPEVRANAYLVLGEIGNASAIPVIRESLGQGMGLLNPIRVRLVGMAAAEALVKLGDQTQIEPIRAALFAPPQQSELTVVACDSLGRLGDEIARPMLERLVSGSGESKRSAEVRLAAAEALVRLSGGPKAGVSALSTGSAATAQQATFRMALAVAREYIADPDPRIRTQVASLLGQIGAMESTALLARLVRDSDPVVQVAAAAGVESAE